MLLKSYHKKNKKFKTGLMTSFILLLLFSNNLFPSVISHNFGNFFGGKNHDATVSPLNIEIRYYDKAIIRCIFHTTHRLK